MTVIACNLEEMAADSLCHEDDSTHYYSTKIFRMNDGTIIGGAGNHPEKIIDWIMRGEPDNDRPIFDAEKDDFSIMHLRHDGIYLYVNSLSCWKLKDKNYAIGCGADTALYCMRYASPRMTPEQAVKEACKVNMFCGGEVDCLKLKD